MDMGSRLSGMRRRLGNAAIACHFGFALSQPVAGDDSHLVEQLKLALVNLRLGGCFLLVAAAIGLPL